jgi:hypothetical protein
MKGEILATIGRRAIASREIGGRTAAGTSSMCRVVYFCALRSSAFPQESGGRSDYCPESQVGMDAD